jgi:ribosome modulation factor
MPEDFQSSNVTDATIRDFYKKAVSAKQEMEQISEALKSATGRYRVILKGAKAAGIDPDDIVYAVKVRHMDRGDLVRQERGKARVMRITGLWPKIQTELFSTDAPTTGAREDDTIEVAYDNGHRCGVTGEQRAINPYSPGSEQWAEFDRGWSVGQEKFTPAKGAKAKGVKKGKANLKLVADPTDMPTDSAVEPLFS